MEPSKFGMELVRPTESNPQEINVAAEARDDYGDLGNVDDASTPIGDDDTFDDLFNEDRGLSPERTAEIEQEQEQEEEQEQEQEQEKHTEIGAEEGRGAVGLTAPARISDKERDDHELTHTPYRSWCSVCVRARGQRMPHRRKRDGDGSLGPVPRISMDYFYMSQKDEEAKENPILVVLNEESNEKYARATGIKGVGTEGIQEWLIKDICEEFKSWGHAGGVGGHIILKSDTEKSMLAFRQAVAEFHGGVVVQESPAKGESESNGAVEGAGRIIKDFTRIFKLQIEDKAGISIDSTDPIFQWCIRWAAMVASRYLVGVDGRTGWERRRGRPCRLTTVPFGEKVWYKQIREGKHKKNQLETEEKEGIWLGPARNSNETLIGTKEGIIRAYTIKRQDSKSRWDGKLIKEMQGTPHQPNPNSTDYNIQTRVGKDLTMRRMMITQAMLTRYGYTEGCEGCRYKRAGLPSSRMHSEKCRSRILEAMGETSGERDEAGLAGAQGDREETGLEGDQGDLLAGWMAAWAAARKAMGDGGDDSIPEEEPEDLARAQEAIDDTDITKAIYKIDIELVHVQNP